MKQTIEKRHQKVVQNSRKLNLDSYFRHKELKGKLKEIGVKNTKAGPRISDPAHVRSNNYN